MTESLALFFTEHLGQHISRELLVFIVSMLPILELRGGIIAGALLGMDFLPNFGIAFVGNILPVPFILLFIEWFLQVLKKTPLRSLALWVEDRAAKKKDTIEKFGYWGIFLFVAIPLPGTGAWTGSLIAALLHMNRKKVFPFIMLGVLGAGVIMTVLSYGVLSFF